MDDQTFLQELNKSAQYTLNISYRLYQKLESHLKILKFLNHPEKNKQTWMLNAIREKLSREEQLQDITKAKHVHFKLKSESVKKINARLEIIRKMHKNFSKKEWFTEAIEEKLETEFDTVKSKLEEYQALLGK